MPHVVHAQQGCQSRWPSCAFIFSIYKGNFHIYHLCTLKSSFALLLTETSVPPSIFPLPLAQFTSFSLVPMSSEASCAHSPPVHPPVGSFIYGSSLEPVRVLRCHPSRPTLYSDKFPESSNLNGDRQARDLQVQRDERSHKVRTITLRHHSKYSALHTGGNVHRRSKRIVTGHSD